MESTYIAKTGSFEGPMELLLSLIEKRKLFINEISLSEVTDDYLSHVRRLNDFPIARIANFIIVAATLILIKSRSLLPEINLTEEETESIGDLEKRLSLYKIVRDAGVRLKELLAGPTIWERPYARNKIPIFSPDESFTVENVHSAIQSVIANLPKKEILPKVTVKKVVSIEEMINSITERIAKEIKTSFSKLSGHTGEASTHENKVNIIVGFLAMLELVKQGIILVSQEKHFEDIGIETNRLSLGADNLQQAANN